MNNLDLFRQTCKFSFPLETISSYEQFKRLTNELCDKKLLHPNQVKRLLSCAAKNQDAKSSENNSEQVDSIQSKIIQFPMTLKQFENIIMLQFGDSNCKELIENLKKYNKMLKQIKGTLNVWKDKGLTNQQRKQLQSIFAKGNQQIKSLCKQLKYKKQVLENINQQQIQMISSLNEWVQMQGVETIYQNFQDYQQKNKSVIANLFKKNQVKQVHFKKDALSKVGNKQFFSTIGFNPKDDKPLQVSLISKTSINFPFINSQLTKYQALKDLSLSEHFAKFLGYNISSNPQFIQYFTEMIEGENLRTTVSQHKLPQSPNQITKYWMYQIFQSFYDIFLMSSYSPVLPLSLKNFQVSDLGLKIIFKDIKFDQKRCLNNKQELKLQKSRKIDQLETQLLQNLGKIFFQILNINPNDKQIIEEKLSYEESCLFQSLLKVSQSHKNYENGIVDSFLSFFNLQTHPLLEQSQFQDGRNLIECFCAQYHFDV